VRDVRKVYPGSPEHSRRWFPGDFLTPPPIADFSDFSP
jgi:hypothetical protein